MVFKNKKQTQEIERLKDEIAAQAKRIFALKVDAREKTHRLNRVDEWQSKNRIKCVLAQAIKKDEIKARTPHNIVYDKETGKWIVYHQICYICGSDFDGVAFDTQEQAELYAKLLAAFDINPYYRGACEECYTNMI